MCNQFVLPCNYQGSIASYPIQLLSLQPWPQRPQGQCHCHLQISVCYMLDSHAKCHRYWSCPWTRDPPEKGSSLCSGTYKNLKLLRNANISVWEQSWSRLSGLSSPSLSTACPFHPSMAKVVLLPPMANCYKVITSPLLYLQVHWCDILHRTEPSRLCWLLLCSLLVHLGSPPSQHCPCQILIVLTSPCHETPPPPGSFTCFAQPGNQAEPKVTSTCRSCSWHPPAYLPSPWHYAPLLRLEPAWHLSSSLDRLVCKYWTVNMKPLLGILKLWKTGFRCHCLLLGLVPLPYTRMRFWLLLIESTSKKMLQEPSAQGHPWGTRDSHA